MDLYFIRHGQTKSNRELRYLGRTDEPLSEEGAEGVRLAGCFPGVQYVSVSPMLRARQTAKILFPNAEQLVYNELTEMDFGDFEGKRAADLADDPAYRKWIASECRTPCPGGESFEDFGARCLTSFEKSLQDALSHHRQQLIFVVHGGVIMQLMERYADPERPFFDWHLKNCACFHARLDPVAWPHRQRFSGYANLEQLSF